MPRDSWPTPTPDIGLPGRLFLGLAILAVLAGGLGWLLV